MLASCNGSKRVLRMNVSAMNCISDEDYTRALRLVASVMARELGEERVARWGGEEFALLFPNQELAAAVALCERLRRAIEAADCQDFAPGLKITASIGVADRSGLAHHEKLVSRADAKLYEAKHSGRNRVVA